MSTKTQNSKMRKAAEAAIRTQPRLTALLFCDFFNRTEQGKYNLSGVFTRMQISADHPQTPRFGLYVRFENIDVTEPNNLAVFGPDGDLGIDGTVIPSLELLQATPRPTDLEVVSWLEFALPKAGRYWFQVSYRGEILGGSEMIVEFLDPEEDSRDDTADIADQS